jgi:hypothetical protein
MSPVSWKTSTSTTVRPVFVSSAIARRDRPAAVAVVSQMRFPLMAGEDQPRPGTGVFQAT